VSWLVSTSLKLRVVVLALCALLMVFGYQSIHTAPLDVFPEFAPPKVEVQTEAPGLSTEEVESLVTMPLENALNGTPGMMTIRSKSVLGLSSIVLYFREGTDLHRVRQHVQERVAAEAPRLPTVARPPVILHPLSSLSRVLKIGIWSRTLSQRDLTELAMWTIRPKLMAVPGVANVAVWGQRDKQFQVLVDPDRLQAYNVTLDQVIKASADATALEAGGFVDTPNQRLAVRQLSPILSPEDLARTVVDYRAGAPLRISDVAEVQFGSPPPIGDAIINDVPGLLLIVEKQPEGNTLTVTRRVEQALAALRPGLKDVEIDSTIFRPATFVERALHNLTHAMLVGCGLVVVILALFLFDWRTALISLTAIPLSLVAAIVVLTSCGITINTMVLAGLVIALGEVVDDAIIDVENIVRRLRLNRAAGSPQSAFEVVLAASLEVRSAVVYASLIVTLVFLPVFYLEGVAGSFFRPLALAYILAILASLVVALVVTPAMSFIMLTGERQAREESPLARLLRRGYAALLPALVQSPRAVLVMLGAIAALTLVAASRLGQEFLPDFQETDFLMHFLERPGASIESMDRMTVRASRELRAIPGVRNFGSHIGRAEVADEVVGPNFTELWISIDPEADYRATLHKIQEAMQGYPGMYCDVQTYLKERSKEVLTGTSASIVVRLFGPDMDGLRAKGHEVEAAMAEVAGVVNLKLEPQVLVPQVQVQMRSEAAERFGLTAGHIRRATTTLLKGTRVGEIYEGQKRYGVVVWGGPELRTDITALQSLLLGTPSGAQVRLSDVADVAIVPAPNEIKREAASRRLDITCNVAGRPLGEVAAEIETKVRALPFEREYHPEFLGEFAAQQQSSRRLYFYAALSLLGIMLLLYVDFQSWRLTGIVMLTITFALTGGVFGVLLTGGVVSLGSLVGFVTVLGIAARNGIMLVSHYRHLEVVEGERFGLALVLRGSEERLAPILMTALATGLALLPLVISGARPGNEIEYPLAIVILGGLVTSTLLNLALVPALYLLIAPSETRQLPLLSSDK
jgi:CzcA family heavy metal efflux pump